MRGTLRDFVVSIPFFLISGVFAWVTCHFQDMKAIADEVIPVGGLPARAAIAGMAIPFYLYKSILPINLLPIYPRWDIPVRGMPDLAFFLPWPLLIAALGWLFAKRNTIWGRNIVFGLGFFLINLFPVLGFFTMSYMRITWVSDHLTYLPLLGLIGLAASAIATLYVRLDSGRRSLMLVACSILLAVTVADSNAYAAVFFNEDLMWTYNLKYNPDAWQAHSRLARVKMDQGKIQEGIYHISESHRLRPDLAETNNNMAQVMQMQGKAGAALTYLRKAHEIEPRQGIYQLNLANSLLSHGDYREAEENFSELLRKEPNNAVAFCNDGTCLYLLGRIDEAIASYKKALAINPDMKSAQENLSVALSKKNGMAPALSPGNSNYDFQLLSHPPGI
jgi:tetratricopeptide (TPR) repeat protein